MADRTKEYNRKRDFSKTKEPMGAAALPYESAGGAEEGLRYVIQHHIASREHYDLRLEWRGALLSWAVPKGPSLDPSDKRLAVRVEDHPTEYKNFEGTIPAGQYGGGTVMLWDEGFWVPLSDVGEGISEGSLKFIIVGHRLEGAWALVRMKADTGGKNDNWLLIKENDAYAKSGSVIAEHTKSVRTGRTMSEISQNI